MKKFLLAALLLASPALAADGVGVGGFDINLNITPVLTPSSAYSANNVVGGLQTANIFRTRLQTSGLLGWINMTSVGGQTTSITVWGFEKKPTSTCTDKAAFVLATADLPYLIPGFPVTVALAATNGQTPSSGFTSFIPPVSVQNSDSPTTTNLYFCATTSGTPTFATAGDLTFGYALIQD